MSVIVEDVVRTTVKFQFPVDASQKKVYSVLFKEFSEELAEDHPALSAEIDSLSKALVARKKTAAKAVVTKVKQIKKRKPPRRSAADDDDVTVEDSDYSEID